jgi:hypothetical protein
MLMADEVTRMRTEDLLADLRSRIQTQHDEDWRMFELLKQRLLTPSDRIVPLSVSAPPEQHSAPDTITLIGSVEQIFQSRPDVAWSVQTLEKQLRQDGFAFEAKNPRSSLNTAVARLAERGLISIYKKGSGRKPHLYKALPSGNSAALRGRMAAIPESQTFSNGKKAEDGGGQEGAPISQ